LRTSTLIIAKTAVCFSSFFGQKICRATIAEPLFLIPRNTRRAVRAGEALKIYAILQNIWRDKTKGNNRQKYGDRQRPIDMLFRAVSNRQNRRQGFETDFSHLAPH
jgi:hypothetical protein